jgi:hypothetical protein
MSVSMCRECGTADAWLIIIILVIKIPQLTIYIYFWRFVLCYSGDQLCLPCRIVTWLKWLLIFIFFLSIMNVLFYCSFYECKFFFTLIVFVVWTWHSQMWEFRVLNSSVSVTFKQNKGNNTGLIKGWSEFELQILYRIQHGQVVHRGQVIYRIRILQNLLVDW